MVPAPWRRDGPVNDQAGIVRDGFFHRPLSTPHPDHRAIVVVFLWVMVVQMLSRAVAADLRGREVGLRPKLCAYPAAQGLGYPVRRNPTHSPGPLVK